jgi:pimeloyl-ACP methyl ester carboxylesterase
MPAMPEISSSLYRAGEGDQVVLLHGFTGTWRHWQPVLADLVARYEVIAPTLAGHDGGPPFDVGPGLTIANAADHLERHLDDLGVGAAHLVGNSMGGSLAIELAKRGRARSVVALSPGGGWELGSPEAERIARFFIRQVRLTRASRGRIGIVMRRAATRRAALRDIMRCGHLVPPPDAIDMALSSIACSVIDEVIGALRHGDDALVKDLDRISAPVLLAWAERDRILPLKTCSSRFAREIPGAELRVLPRVGHVPMWDDTRLVVDTIVGWIASHSDAPAEADAAAA